MKNNEVNVYVYPKGLVRQGQKSPSYVRMKSIYKNTPSALISMLALQGEEGQIVLEGDEELTRNTEWGTKCQWCDKKYYFDNMLIIIDKEGIESMMCPRCYKEITGEKINETVQN